MSEKLQAFAASAKSVILYILTPIFFVLGCFFLLWKKNERLETELAETKADEKLEGLKDAQTTIDNTASADTASYDKLRAEFLANEQPKKS